MTLTEIVLGFGLTLVTAIPLGLLIALSPIARQILYPPIMLLQLVPKIAVAPLFLVWLGFGIESKVLLTVLMTFFPLLLASISGFQILDNRLLYLTKSMGASTWQTFRFLRVPAALPVIFSGIKASATIAATAAIVAEFVGANQGLGYVLLKGTSTMDIELTFAVLVVLTMIGIIINYVVEFSEWLMAPWQRAPMN
ncbi:ABC transporter permease subunit [Bradyrhizobium lablabi]|uniref:ABC transporter permease n=1 Tax=Bradyrhizobium lablabi TaxID=722472 RepID=UPI001BA8349D|nr:ABC transporter permease subunit [Bradyrhizobium lablabi]MBR0695488.1 ABC transporter permease subunit [Bradyrhizobium lablabi]